MEKLLTKQDLAKRWDVTTVTIDRWVSDGVISPVKGIPSIRFNPEHVMKLEGTEISKLSPLERKKLLNEIEDLKRDKQELKKENEDLKNYVKTVFSQGARFITI